ELPARKGLDSCEQLLQEYPRVLLYLRLYHQAFLVLSEHILKDKPQEVLVLSNRSIPFLENTLRRQPEVSQIKPVLALMLGSRSRALTLLGRFPEAHQDWDRALPLSPAGLQTRMRLGRAITLAYQGRHRAAVEEAQNILATGKV